MHTAHQFSSCLQCTYVHPVCLQQLVNFSKHLFIKVATQMMSLLRNKPQFTLFPQLVAESL